MENSLFDKYNIIETLESDEYTSVYLVEDVKTKEKFILRQLPGDTTNPLYKTAVSAFKEMSRKSIKLSRKASSPAILDCFVEGKNSYLLLEYREDLTLKNITSYPIIGKILNKRYAVIRGIAGGGFGMVYLVRDLNLPGKYWALKEMHKEGG
ncbi:MAG TPA: hypothetical protein PL110_12540, partial [Candidatus Eremiobacteraeota bacterium]|nr:hypothetical protein [Candidatus Eremiobacteraeota bacterium]